jgi:NAD(P)-dependent dehydrogenase (short-subunit alcohol dehydrogenase family)
MKHAIITGSSSGFGKLIAIELAKSGYDVTATMRNLKKKDHLLELAAAEKVTDQIQLFQLDVTIDESIQEFKRFVHSLDSVDLLVNNAGYAQGGFSEELEVDTYRKQFETNFFGVIAVTQAVLPFMRQQRYGKIINMSSISGRFGFPGLSAYAASKHALEGYSESLRLELKPFPMHDQSPYESSMEAIMKELKTAEASYGNPQDVARLVSGIASANSPQLRYPIGKGIKNTLFLKNLLPWKMIEKIVIKKLNM